MRYHPINVIELMLNIFFESLENAFKVTKLNFKTLTAPSCMLCITQWMCVGLFTLSSVDFNDSFKKKL